LAAEENAHAYTQCESVWDELRDAASDESILALRREALASVPSRTVSGKWIAGWAALAASIVVAFVAVPSYFTRSEGGAAVSAQAPADLARQQTYRTPIGEQATVRLADGSELHLNTDTELEVDFSPRLRRVTLVKGQAFFRVAPDKSRPFAVEAAGRTITALGTEFDVKVSGDQLQVTLVEGRVAVSRDGSAAEPLRPEPQVLTPGQQLIVSAWQDVQVMPTSVERITSWRNGRLVFEDERLGEVIAEMNRYSNRRLVLGDPALADLRISGVFRTGSVSNFAAALSASFPVETAVDPASNTVVVRARETR